mmetsp:Transcript_17339/g.26509  ORF Transcript_17339/g.26509 Transcript_17339/m.26509 type:complete len:111 (-) Transcript_17339:87-419(-)
MLFPITIRFALLLCQRQDYHSRVLHHHPSHRRDFTNDGSYLYGRFDILSGCNLCSNYVPAFHESKSRFEHLLSVLSRIGVFESIVEANAASRKRPNREHLTRDASLDPKT